MVNPSPEPDGQAAAASNGEARQPVTVPDQDRARRDILPIPDVKHVGLTTYDAKDPDTTYPPITCCARPRARPMC